MPAQAQKSKQICGSNRYLPITISHRVSLEASVTMVDCQHCRPYCLTSCPGPMLHLPKHQPFVQLPRLDPQQATLPLLAWMPNAYREARTHGKQCCTTCPGSVATTR